MPKYYELLVSEAEQQKILKSGYKLRHFCSEIYPLQRQKKVPESQRGWQKQSLQARWSLNSLLGRKYAKSKRKLACLPRLEKKSATTTTLRNPYA